MRFGLDYVINEFQFTKNTTYNKSSVRTGSFEECCSRRTFSLSKQHLRGLLVEAEACRILDFGGQPRYFYLLIPKLDTSYLPYYGRTDHSIEP